MQKCSFYPDSNSKQMCQLVVLVFQLWIISGPAFLVILMVTFGVCNSVPPTPPTASAAEESEPFFRGLKQVKCFSLYRLSVNRQLLPSSILSHLLIRYTGTSPFFWHFLTSKGENFVTSCLLSCATNSFQGESSLTGKNLL